MNQKLKLALSESLRPFFKGRNKEERHSNALDVVLDIVEPWLKKDEGKTKGVTFLTQNSSMGPTRPKTL